MQFFRRKDVENNLHVEIPNNFGIEFEKLGAGNDMLLFLLTAIRYSYFGYVSKPLSHFRKHSGSITESNDLNSLYYSARVYFVEKSLFQRVATV